METAHITIIALGALLALCIGLLIRARWLIRLKSGAIDNYIRWHKEGTRVKQELEEVKREKRELEERLKAMSPAKSPRKGRVGEASRRSNKQDNENSNKKPK